MRTIFIPTLPLPVVVDSVEGENLDAFDCSDGFASCANFNDGTPLNDHQLDIFTDSDAGSMLLFNMACDPC